MQSSINIAAAVTKTTVISAVLCVLSAFSTGADAETLSQRSGKSGQIILEARVDGRTDLRGLMILEKSDRPCVVQVYGTSVQTKRYEGRISECFGGGPKQAKGIDSTKGKVFISGGGSYVTGLKVCLSKSDRVKGWTIYGRNGVSPNTVSDSFKRNNCPNNGWQDRVDCPPNTKAIGVRGFFKPGSGNRSAILRGLMLICD